MSKQAKIGILFIVSAIALYFGFNFLKGSDFLSRVSTYYVHFDNVNGLTISNAVMLNGLQVGRVNNIEVLQKENNRIRVELQVRSDIELGKGTIGVLGDNGLLGGKMIDLKVSKEKPLIASGGTLVGKLQEGLMAQVTQKADPIVAKVDTLLTNFNKMVKGLTSMEDDLKAVMRNAKNMTESLQGTLSKGELDRLLTTSTATMQNFNKLLQGFQPIMSKLDTMAGKFAKLELQQTIDQAKGAMGKMNTLLGDLQQGKGSIGALMKTDSLHRTLVKSMADLDKILIDFRENPKRYLDLRVIGGGKKE
jgi:phospholipid/cholesterol/gamma-HCH transport system substrate-binding protein